MIASIHFSYLFNDPNHFLDNVCVQRILTNRNRDGSVSFSFIKIMVSYGAAKFKAIGFKQFNDISWILIFFIAFNLFIKIH